MRRAHRSLKDRNAPSLGSSPELLGCADFTTARVTAERAKQAVLEGENAQQRFLYEEYHPYGSTAYRASKSGVEVSARRYRYTGKERDEETGLYYYGARYYAAWLGRWTSADPLGLQAGLNLYLYCRAGPVTYLDPDGLDVTDAKHAVPRPDGPQPEASVGSELAAAGAKAVARALWSGGGDAAPAPRLSAIEPGSQGIETPLYESPEGPALEEIGKQRSGDTGFEEARGRLGIYWDLGEGDVADILLDEKYHPIYGDWAAGDQAAAAGDPRENRDLPFALSILPDALLGGMSSGATAGRTASLWDDISKGVAGEFKGMGAADLGLGPTEAGTGAAGGRMAPRGPSAATTVLETPEVSAPRPLKPHEAVERWNKFLGEGPLTNIHPRTGVPDPNRVVSADRTRSIRYGKHEMSSSPQKHHFHEETWDYDPETDIMSVFNTQVRVPLGGKPK
jgi:RHS repeat-associated protein